MNYVDTYKHMTRWFDTPEKVKILKWLDKICTGMMYLCYPLSLIYVGIYKSTMLIKLISIPAISFVLVSLFRKFYNKKRPYECGIPSLLKKDTKGQSMPSRHIFSSSIISMCVLSISIPLGIFCWIITILNSVVRVLGGVHYPSDILVGMVLGILFGLLL